MTPITRGVCKAVLAPSIQDDGVQLKSMRMPVTCTICLLVLCRGKATAMKARQLMVSKTHGKISMSIRLSRMGIVRAKRGEGEWGKTIHFGPFVFI